VGYIFRCHEQGVVVLAALGYSFWESHVVEKAAQSKSTHTMTAGNNSAVPASAWGDAHGWSTWKMMKVVGMAGVAGLIAGLLGVGGGTLLSPMLLELELHPLVAAATSSTLVSLSSISAALTYVILEELNNEVRLGLVCNAVSMPGQSYHH
jgi:uncharacterized membrane protein YfcA